MRSFHQPLPVRPIWLPLLVLAMVVGCGDGSNTSTVHGTVTHEGKTLERGTLLFNPVDASLPPSRATIQSDGTYELAAVPGDYKITVSLFSETDPNLEPGDPGYEEPKSLIPVKYSSLNSTPLRGTVESQETAIDLEL
jgi:hypothetical protein